MTATLEARTRDHLATAERNRNIADALFVADPMVVQPAPFEWVAVLAFYSAVHLVNALLWERTRYEPRDHRDRHAIVDQSPELRSCQANYARLRAIGFRARYVPLYGVSGRQARVLVELDLGALEWAVYAALGLPPPTR